jgi:glycine/D-amino acid oxidase-like deaminating enzyme
MHVGASIRNFGHCCVTTQSSELYVLAQAARRHWLDYAKRAGFWAAESGGLVVARSSIELQVLKELASAREAGQVTLLDAEEVTSRLLTAHGTPDPGIQGGALLRDDLRVDPRTTVAALAAWLQQQGVRFLWKTSSLGLGDGVVHTSRGACLRRPDDRMRRTRRRLPVPGGRRRARDPALHPADVPHGAAGGPGPGTGRPHRDVDAAL